MTTPAADAVGTLGDEAQKRKARLLALKRKMTTPATLIGQSRPDEDEDEHKEKVPGDGDVEAAEQPVEIDEAKKAKGPAFRSYKPQNESLQESSLPAVKPVDVESHVSDHLAAGQVTSVPKEVDLASLQPRKIDWDLKRDIAKKLEKLERRTQRVIAEVIRERLTEQKTENIFDVVDSMNNLESMERRDQSGSDEDD